MKNKFIVILFCLFGFSSIFAFPKEIFIVRHGDKLDLPNPGPTLSPKGIVRSMALAFNFLDKFGEPDFIIATNPNNANPHDSSIRELQTVAPLANMLAERHKKGFPILHPFLGSDYPRLASYVLSNEDFNGKRVLICWDHTVIPELAAELGVKETLKKWPSEVFDSVYVLQYDEKGNVKKFEILTKQYSVSFNGSWKELSNKIA